MRSPTGCSQATLFSLDDVFAKLARHNHSCVFTMLESIGASVRILENRRQIISTTVRLMRRLRDNAGVVVITALSVPGDRVDDDDCFFRTRIRPRMRNLCKITYAERDQSLGECRRMNGAPVPFLSICFRFPFFSLPTRR